MPKPLFVCKIDPSQSAGKKLRCFLTGLSSQHVLILPFEGYSLTSLDSPRNEGFSE